MTTPITFALRAVYFMSIELSRSPSGHVFHFWIQMAVYDGRLANSPTNKTPRPGSSYVCNGRVRLPLTALFWCYPSFINYAFVVMTNLLMPCMFLSLQWA
jgi:hypothetical protein